MTKTAGPTLHVAFSRTRTVSTSTLKEPASVVAGNVCTQKMPQSSSMLRIALWINYHGFTRHMSVQQFPRLITEVLRGTDRHRRLKALRSASERTNSTAKDDFSILVKPRVRGLRHAGVLSQLAATVVLLKRISSFIIKVTISLWKKPPANRDFPHRFMPGPLVPNSIGNLIQRE